MEINTWKITEKNYSEKLNKNFEGLFAQGNGYISMRGSFDEDLSSASQKDIYWRMPANVTLEKPRHPISKWGIYVPLIVGSHPILNEEMINLPYCLGLNIYLDDERFDMDKSHYTDYLRELDLKTAVLKRSLTWLCNENRIELKFERFISMVRKNIIVQELKLKPLDNDVEIKIESFIEGDVTTNGYNHFKEREVGFDNEFIKCCVKTDLDDEVLMLSKLILPKRTESKFCALGNRVINTKVIKIKRGEELLITKISLVKTSKDKGINNLFNDSFEELKRAIADINLLLNEHVERWKDKWELSDIKIKGDEKSQLALRFSIYHLLRAVNEGDFRVAIDAKGAAGEAYFGHYFWDTEIYLYPFYLYTNPKAAKNLLMFRVNTLKAAKDNAREYGYRGAKYPWESSISGKEQCSNFQYKDHEIHISADIAYAMWNYYMTTGDKDTLFNEFFDVIFEISRFYIDRTYKEKDGTYSISGVMGPDEYLAFTNNNAYTNYMVRFCLDKTLETLKLILNSDKKLYKEKINSLKINEDELKKIKDVSEKINIPIDNENKFIWQCDNFDDFEDIDFDRIWLDRNKPFGHYISQERNYRSKALKQGDVIALIYLFNKYFDMETIENCMKYYEPITTHDSSLSYIIHSILYSKLNNRDKAYEYFKKAAAIDLYSYNASEGIHIANCGGIWQAVVFGFCGLKSLMFESEIKLEPSLPKGWEEVEFKFFYKNTLYNITTTQREVLIEKI